MPREKLMLKLLSTQKSIESPLMCQVGDLRALVWKQGVLINIRIYLICQQICQMSAPTKLGGLSIGITITPYPDKALAIRQMLSI